MAEEKKSAFTITDRRKFTDEGELKPDVARTEEEQPAEPPKASAPTPVAEAPAPSAAGPELVHEEMVQPPSEEELASQSTDYAARTKKIDERLQKELDARGGGRTVQDFEMTFEKFIASIYMTALMQLGLVQEQGAQGAPRADIMGARQTIDTLSLLSEKTKGNLTEREELMLQNCLYELRMAYIEITNAITAPPKGPLPPNPFTK